ncbi:hypothetical protein Pfo_009423 [Paulownia fortunei]|nr:hypothetical protein Pfo_009423 [Paulownia fortunei]
MSFKMGKHVFVVLFTLLLLIGGVYSVSVPSSPAKIVNRFLSNAFSMLMKWVLSLKVTTKTAISGRPIMKFESGYIVETVFDGSKLGIEPYSVEVLPDGDLLILDSANSNFTRFFHLYSRPKLVSGSAEGYSGHVDGRSRETRMKHPKGLTVDDKGNIYVADTDNVAIRKISDTGVSTIAGGKQGRGGGHVDGPSEDAKFSNDFDVVFIGSSCSLLVIDHGNKAIREIQLKFDDCAYQYVSGFPLYEYNAGIAVLIAAGFFGYMLALLQRRVGSIVSSQDDQGIMKESVSPYQYQKPLKSSRPPLIPTENEQENQENFLGSFGRLVAQTGASAAEILGGVFPVFQKKPLNHQYRSQHQYRQQQHSNAWPVQESFFTPDEDELPTTETRTPAPQKTYAFMSKDSEKVQHLRQNHAFYSGWDGNFPQQQQTKKQEHHHQYHSSAPQTLYQQSSERSNERVFGEVQEQDKHRDTAVIKPLDQGIPVYNRHTIRSRVSYANGHCSLCI